ncbi:hypothetical protein BOW53_10675 [Solemya pervernicosa gill symbiont]|uniref:Peptidase M42 n=1 Tax=Solemya pervernicosa gill symbiont TaxID=642797 RepID=A0A1T2L3T2_9GAMM|nr:hypothetical protein [Solemya pervernicosa gill symbiont]OOZ39670.1 hypothetical protein BOW53_10675 [Solemya pervernicosa gill symbiont]
MDKVEFERLKALLSQPAAPFREMVVKQHVFEQLNADRIPHFEDRHGNIIVGVENKAAYLALVQEQSSEPLRLFIAHMDHPGFHVTRRLSAERVAVKWYGGSPIKHLNNARVWVCDGYGEQRFGKLQKAKLHKSGRVLERAEVQLEEPLIRGTKVKSLYGGLAFRAPFWKRGSRIYTRAADDLVGVFSILETAKRLFKSRTKKSPPFIGLLTRAEEVGFVGAVNHLELGWLKGPARPLLAVSLEASRTLPGAEIGKGPVVRLGDRRTVFSSSELKVLSDLAEKLLPKRHQRKLMDGGACEASATTAWGIPTVGMSIPLGNYHNQGFEGGDDCKHPEGPAPEFVDILDIEGLVTLCAGLMKRGLPWQKAWDQQRIALRKNAKGYRDLWV